VIRRFASVTVLAVAGCHCARLRRGRGGDPHLALDDAVAIARVTTTPVAAGGRRGAPPPGPRRRRVDDLVIEAARR
jgi:hypothetical protein